MSGVAGLAAVLVEPGLPSSTKAATKALDNLQAAFGIGITSVSSHGAIGNGEHDDTEAFLRACGAVPLNGVVLVPRTPGFYRLRNSVPLESRSLIGVGWPTISLDVTGATTDLLRVSVETGTYDRWHQGGTVSGLILDGRGKGRDLIRVTGSDSPQLRDLRLFGAGRDSVHVEGVAEGSWTESLNLTNVFASSSGRDNFHLAIPPEHDFTFVNQTTFLNCKSRSPGRYALACINRSIRGGDNSKISEVSWISGELDGSGSPADDIVLLQSVGPGLVECINFYDVAIEDDHVAHPGFAIGVDARAGGKVGPVRANGCIAYGAASGLLNRTALGTSDAEGGAIPTGTQMVRGRTARLDGAQAQAIGATAPSLLQKVFALTAEPAQPIRKRFGEWTVFGDAVAVVTENGCSLSTSDGRLMLRNTGGESSIFEWRIQPVG